MSRRSLLLVAVLCLGCREAAEVVVDDGPPPAVSTDFSRLPELLAGIPKTGTILLYEGLPSEFWEPQLRTQELARKETFDIHGYPVYKEPLTPSGTDVEQLTSLFSARESYQPYSDRKKCGGFSAEHGIEWTTGESTTQLLICLECGEVMLFGPQSELRCNLSPAASQRLKTLLTPYQTTPPSAKPNPRSPSRARCCRTNRDLTEAG